MERLRAIADAHYRAAPPAVKALAYDFFKALDNDQDGRVSLHEFLSLMKHLGHTRLANPFFFRELDRNGNGTLDFWEVLTLYYIIKSGRPLCECCGILIPGTFFSCVECFDTPALGSYSLCIYCYRSNKSNHNHNGHQQFLDTFTLLENKKNSSSGRGRTQLQNQEPRFWHWTKPTTGQTQIETDDHMHNTNHNVSHQLPIWSPPTPDATVAADTMNKWKTALAALEIGLSIGSISTTLCTIL